MRSAVQLKTTSQENSAETKKSNSSVNANEESYDFLHHPIAGQARLNNSVSGLGENNNIENGRSSMSIPSSYSFNGMSFNSMPASLFEQKQFGDTREFETEEFLEKEKERVPQAVSISKNFPTLPGVQRKCSTCGTVMYESDELFSGNKAERKCANCEAEQRKILQRKETGNADVVLSDAVTEALQSKGQPLDPNTRAFMAKGIDYNFSKVNIHNDALVDNAYNDMQLQSKLNLNRPGDIYEQEADAVADKIMRMTDEGTVQTKSSPVNIMQRKCATCGKEEGIEEEEVMGNGKNTGTELTIQRKCAKCKEEEEKNLQRKELANKTPGVSAPVIEALRSSGQPLDNTTRSFMEQRFGHDFGNVRIHNDNLAHQSSSAIHALAYTHQNHVFFGNGQYKPETYHGKHLLAHELTHVMQQSGDTISRQEATTATGGPQVQQAAYIVEDFDAPAAGQMHKSDFLRLLNGEVCQTVDQALQGTPHSSDNCPYIKAAFSRHSNSTPFELEQLLRRYEPSTFLARNAQALIQMVLVRVKAAVERWKRTGDLSGVPQEIAAQIRGGQPATGSANSGAGVSFKANPGGAHATQSPVSVMQRLGKGSMLDGTTRGRMESTFGSNFSNVEIHTDSEASGLSNDMNARAFTVGDHIAFGTGEYKPGTLIGDALIAHELAHVVQQENAGTDISAHAQKGTSEETFLEEDADFSAVRAVLSIWAGLKGGLKDGYKKAMPRLRSGLKLQRCVAAAAAPEVALLIGGAAETTAVVGGGAAVAGGITATDVLIGGAVIGTGGLVLEGDSPRPTPAQATTAAATAAATITIGGVAYRTAQEAVDAAKAAGAAAAAAAATVAAAKIAECEAIHAFYSSLADCVRCRPTDTAAERAAKILCIETILALRYLYLSKGCDYILPGSIARGSQDAANGHWQQVAQLTQMLGDCATMPTT
ncbi:MAG: DUF4157 domain-containing protein [Ginsengibacter sp.]